MEHDAFEGVVRRLSRTYPDLPEGTVDEAVLDVVAAFRDARVANFLPILVEKQASDRLRHLPHARRA